MKEIIIKTNKIMTFNGNQIASTWYQKPHDESVKEVEHSIYETSDGEYVAVTEYLKGWLGPVSKTYAEYCKTTEDVKIFFIKQNAVDINGNINEEIKELLSYSGLERK